MSCACFLPSTPVFVLCVQKGFPVQMEKPWPTRVPTSQRPHSWKEVINHSLLSTDLLTFPLLGFAWIRTWHIYIQVDTDSSIYQQRWDNLAMAVGFDLRLVLCLGSEEHKLWRSEWKCMQKSVPAGAVRLQELSYFQPFHLPTRAHQTSQLLYFKWP